MFQVRRSLVGLGDYDLCEAYKGYYVPLQLWQSWTKENRDKHFDKFVSKVPFKDKRIVVSSNNKCVTLRSTHGGKKPGQRKRRRSERTESHKKASHLLILQLTCINWKVLHLLHLNLCAFKY